MKEQEICSRKDCTFSPVTLKADRIFPGLIRKLEILGSAWPLLGKAYRRLFYARMLKYEISSSRVMPGMHVMHVGCGPLPMTAMELARQGLRVTAADLEPEALARAEKVLIRAGLEDRVRLLNACGTILDFSGYDAVWLSLHVRPMDRILERVMHMVRPGARIIFRDPRKILCRYYPPADKKLRYKGFQRMCRNQILGKKSVILIKKPGPGSPEPGL